MKPLLQIANLIVNILSMENKTNLTKEKPNKYAGKTFKTVTTSMKLGGDKKKNIVKGGGKVGDAVNKVAKDMTKK